MQMAEALGRVAQGQPLQAGQPQYQQPAQTPNAPVRPTNEMWTERPNEAAAMVAQMEAAEALKPALQGMTTLTQQASQMMRSLAQQQFRDDFSKWGPEIDGHMANVPVEHRTLDNYEKVVKLVRGNHLDEIVAERARQMVATGALGERSTSVNGVAVSSVPGLDPNKIPAGFKEVIQRTGLTEDQVKSFCRTNNMTLDSWVKQMSDGDMFSSASPFQITLSEAKLGINKVFE